MILRFAHPSVLLFALPVFALMIHAYRRRLRAGPRIRFSDLELLRTARPRSPWAARHGAAILRFIAVLLLIVALARPQAGARGITVNTEGVDILVALDVSSSMQAVDLQPNNRLDAAKSVAADFIRGRESDRIGIVVFAAVSFVQCPLTLDYEVLLGLLDDIHIGMVEDGTAIGMAIVNCVNRLKESDAKSKVAILLTDGVNNTGRIDPATASNVAATMGVRIYTIGIGKQGEALYPVDDPIFGRRLVKRKTEIDEETLRRIAEETGGRYYRATDTDALRRIFKEIGDMEKTEITSDEYVNYTDLFGRFLIPAAALLLLEALFSATVLRRFP
ncbi:MAG: VWA domain-containing protein [Candidatus Eisenbacteria bacterium]